MSKFLPILFKKKTQVDTFLWSSDDEEEPTTSATSRLELAGSSVKEDFTPESMEPSVKEDLFLDCSETFVEDLTLGSMEPSAREDPGLGDTEPSPEDPSIDSKEPSIKMEHQMNLGLATIFSYEELKEATSSFDSSRVIGEGGFGRVYRGNFHGRMVAVKLHILEYQYDCESLFKEVKYLFQLRHDNLATVYGSTGTGNYRKKMVVVHEYASKGTLGYHLHGSVWPRPPSEQEQIGLSWALRIRIATETAEALLYLHSLKPPFVHKNLTTSNIWLDGHYHVKLTGSSMLRKHENGDPAYGQRDNYTTYDVYSFGLILLHLISGKAKWDVPSDVYGVHGENLSKWLLNLLRNNELDQLVDKKLNYRSNLDTEGMVISVAELAYRCLLPERDKRPTMVEVLLSLKMKSLTVN